MRVRTLGTRNWCLGVQGAGPICGREHIVRRDYAVVVGVRTRTRLCATSSPRGKDLSLDRYDLSDRRAPATRRPSALTGTGSSEGGVPGVSTQLAWIVVRITVWLLSLAWQ